MSASSAHIAGVGFSLSTKQDLNDAAVSSIAKALLDAGITYAKVGLSIACSLENGQLRIPKSCFKEFGRQKASVCGVDNHCALFTAAQCMRSGDINCALVVGLDKQPSTNRASEGSKISTVAFVLVSDRFLISHAYLKDSAIRIRAITLSPPPSTDAQSAVASALRQAKMEAGDIQMVEWQGTALSSSGAGEIQELKEKSAVAAIPAPLKGFGSTGLAGLCGIVWRLRGWTHEPKASICNSLQYVSTPDGSGAVAILGRFDEQPVPAHEEVKHLRDGRERLGYNPAERMKEVEWRMEGVRSREGDRLPLSESEELSVIYRRGDRAALARL